MRYLIITVVLVVTILVGLSVLQTAVKVVTRYQEKQVEILEMIK